MSTISSIRRRQHLTEKAARFSGKQYKALDMVIYETDRSPMEWDEAIRQVK